MTTEGNVKRIWAVNEATSEAHRFNSEVEFEYGNKPLCGAEREGAWRKRERGEHVRRCSACADFGFTPEERAKLEVLRNAFVGRSFTLGEGVLALIELRRRVQGFVGPKIENAWSTTVYQRAEREGHPIVPWVTARYQEAVARLEMGAPLEIAGDG
jgi:hypothetical protein